MVERKGRANGPKEGVGGEKKGEFLWHVNRVVHIQSVAVGKGKGRGSKDNEKPKVRGHKLSERIEQGGKGVPRGVVQQEKGEDKCYHKACEGDSCVGDSTRANRRGEVAQKIERRVVGRTHGGL